LAQQRVKLFRTPDFAHPFARSATMLAEKRLGVNGRRKRGSARQQYVGAASYCRL